MVQTLVVPKSQASCLAEALNKLCPHLAQTDGDGSSRGKASNDRVGQEFGNPAQSGMQEQRVSRWAGTETDAGIACWCPVQMLPCYAPAQL